MDRAGWAVFLFGFLLFAPAASAAPRPPVEMVEDAALNDVFFLDPDRGWAVGDRGAIWRTDDGGRRWRLQDSPVGARLHAVWFLDGEHGWAVGGTTRPYTHNSSGVVLRTQDGGQTWRPLASMAIPTLHHIRMFDSKFGWAAGAASPLHPAGVYRTEDGGRGWASVGGHRPTGWETADFRDAVSGVIAGRGGAALVGMNRFQPAAAPLDGRHIVRQVRLAEENTAWLVGDAGLVLHSRNRGATWDAPPTPLPPDAAEQFDFRALAVRGRQVWIAGTPGTRVFHSPDGGVTWEEFSTQQRLPIRALFFLDEFHGWAVGELGMILVTRDGGRSWMPSRIPAARLAVLGVFADPQATPWELFARLSGSEGYLSGAEYVLPARDANATPTETSLADRAHEAMLSVGGSLANTSNPTSNELEECLVRKIRQWRPEVLVTEAAVPTANDRRGRLVGQALLAAVNKAEDPQAYPHHARGGLEPWSVKKVYSVQPRGGHGSVALITASLAPRLGATLADCASTARSLLESEYRAPPAKIEFQLLIDRVTGGAVRSSDFVAGLTLPAPSEARRQPSELSAGSLDLVARTAQKQRNIQQVLAHSLEQSGDAVVGQVDDLTRGFPEAAAGDVLFQLGERLRQQGRSDLAAELYQRLLQQHPQHDASEAAALRLVHYFASSEVGWRHAAQTQMRAGVGVGVQPAAFTAPADDAEEPSAAPPSIRAPIQIRDALATTAASADPRDRDARAIALGQALFKSRPALYAEPAVRFALAAAARRQGDPREAERFFQQIATREPVDAWAACAMGELWFMKPVGPPPKKMLRCAVASEKPFLDGRLDDAAWRNAAPSTLYDAEGNPAAATVQAARDEEYLYLAVQCRKAPEADYPENDQPRDYDAPLEERDRVEFLIDVDRDYATYYRLAVDHRGCTAEACLGDASWNPQWFVAASSDVEQWTIEAAIPFRQLAPQAPRRRDVWALGVQRMIPRSQGAVEDADFQSWTTPAAPRVRAEGFGYLLFEG